MADSKASKLRLPSKIGRPCCTVPPKPALPPSPPRSTMTSPYVPSGKLPPAEPADRFVEPNIAAGRRHSRRARGVYAHETARGIVYSRRGPRHRALSESLFDLFPRSTVTPLTDTMEPLWESRHGRRLSETGVRRGSDTSVVLTEETDSFIIGDRVWVGGTKPGSIAYIGETQFAPGDWAGVVLDEPIGKNDGSVAGSRYFQCEPKRGIFSRLTRLTRQPLPEATIVSPTGEKTPASPPDGSRGHLNKSMSPSLNASTTSLASVSHKDLKLGDRVIVSSSQGSKTGVLRFVGTTEFASGEWCGVELDEAVGKNDGSVGETRYFECRPRHGLFAPMHKVSRSPSSRRTSSACAVHKPTGASMNSSVRRIAGSRESLASMSSVASTNASVATRGTTSGSRRPGLRTSTPARSSMQEILKEKQQEIEMLRKERDFERERISKAATQADNAEQTVMTLKREHDRYREDMEKTVREAQVALSELLEEKNTLKAHLEEERQKSEDLLFRFEEETVDKDDIQVANTLNESRLKELEEQLSEERERVLQLEQENTKLFEAEEEIAKLRTELASALNHEERDFQAIENRNMCLEEAKITLEKQMLERNDLIEHYAEQIRNYEARLNERDRDPALRTEPENNLENHSDDARHSSADKGEPIEKMKREDGIELSVLTKEIEHLKGIIEDTAGNSAREMELLAEEHRRIVDEKEKTIKSQNERLEAETKRHSGINKSALDKLQADSVERINELSVNFNRQLADRDLQISSVLRQLEVKSAEIERLVDELSIERSSCHSKDEELKKLLERVKELDVQLKAREDTNDELKKKIHDLRSQSDKSHASFAQEKQKLEESMASLLASSTDSSGRLEKLSEYLRTKENELSELREAKAAEIEQLRKNFESQIEDKAKYITEINADISEKSLRLSALENEIAELKSIIAGRDEEIKNLSEKTSALHDSITLSEQTKTDLESELRKYDANIVELNKKLSRAEEKSSQLTEQKTKLETEIANVISTSTNSTDQLAKYNEDLRGKEKELDELRDHSFQIENSLAVAERKITTILEESTKSKELAKEYRSELDELKNRIATEIKEKVELTSELEELKTKDRILLETAKDKKKLDAELKIKNIEISELTDKLGRAEESIVAASEKYRSLQEEASEKEKRLEGIAIDSKNEITHLRDEWNKSAEISETLKVERAELEKTVELLTKKLDCETEEKNKLESSIADKNCQMERLEDKIAETKKERDKADATANVSSAKYNETLMELALLKSARASAETESSIELSNLKEQLSRAVSDNGELTDRLRDNDKSAKESREKLKEFVEVLKTKESEITELSNGLREAEASVEKLRDLLDGCRKEFNEKLEKTVNENSVLKNLIESLKCQSSGMESESGEKNRDMKEIEGRSESFGRKLEEFASSSRVSETEAQSFARLVNDVRGEKKDLQEKIVVLSNDSDSKGNLSKETRNKTDGSCAIRANMARDGEEGVATELEAEQSKVEELRIQNENLRIAKESIEKSLRAEEEKIESLSNMLRENESSTAENLRSLDEELNSARMEAAQSKENQNRLEQENKQIVEKLNQALEDLKTFHENKKNNQEIENCPTNLKIESAGSGMNRSSDRHNESKKLTDENETYRGQIEFLNSVIVDMQRKNETLVCKIEVLEMGVPAGEADDYSRSTLDKRMAAPRMFCDICDQFDLHETEDCPRQDQDFGEAEKPQRSQKKTPIDRPYCDNCEVFGHDTLNCDEAETF